MNPMQQMMMQAQKMQRDLAKAHAQINEKEFTVSKGGAVTVTMLGNRELKEIKIDEDAFDVENKEMVEEMIVMAINELVQTIDKEHADANEKITGRRDGLGI